MFAQKSNKRAGKQYDLTLINLYSRTVIIIVACTLSKERKKKPVCIQLEKKDNYSDSLNYHSGVQQARRS